MQYPLEEQIGEPDLFVGREKEFRNFGTWIENIPRRLSKSRVILARRKSGKTAFVQRIFNQLWSANGAVIPFYFELQESPIWLVDLAFDYYRAFASQYISFLERDEQLIREVLSLEEIREYGATHEIPSFARDIDMLHDHYEKGFYSSLWGLACEAPHRFASVYNRRFLVILDEFQYLTQFVYPDQQFQTKPIDSMPGSYHSLSESKIAPMLVTGSYIGWLLKIQGKYLEGGRLWHWRMPPYLTPEAGLQAVYKYAEYYHEPISNETALLINQLCFSDPFFISCVMHSNYDDRDLTTDEGVMNTVNYEIANRESQMSLTWEEYLDMTLKRINDMHAKNMLLYLNKHADRSWSTHEIKDALHLDELTPEQIKEKLVLMSESDVIERGVSDIQFRGLQDGTLNLILRNRFEEEINNFVLDLKQEFQEQLAALKKENRRLQGMLNHLSGQFAEMQLALSFRSAKRFALSTYFSGVSDTTRLNIIDVKHRAPLQRENGKRMELDVIAESSCGRVVIVEVKKTKDPTGPQAVEDFLEKLKVYAQQSPEKTILPAFLSLGGFTTDARQLCEKHGIGAAERIAHF